MRCGVPKSPMYWARFDLCYPRRACVHCGLVVSARRLVRVWLQSGVVLCELINAIEPQSAARPSTSAMPFKQMENINTYTDACRRLGVPESDLFVTVDLYEGKNMPAVVRNLHSLGRVAQKRGFHGPSLGARLASRNVRQFSEAQINAARAMPARWTNRGSTITLSDAVEPRAASPEQDEGSVDVTLQVAM